MLVVFLLIIVVGLVAFALVFKKELGGEGPPAAKEGLHLQDFPLSKNPAPDKTVQPPVPKPAESKPTGREENPGIKEELLQKLDQKCFKLEQLLDEKNRVLAKLEEELKHEQNHRPGIDGVKEVLQQEIEELKLQNKQLKEEMSRILEENVALQSKVSGLEKVLGGQMTAPFVEQGGPAIEPTQGIKLNLPEPSGVSDAGHPAESALTLRDVFGDDTTEQK